MIIEPERYFQYIVPKLHTLWNGRIRDFSHQAIAGFLHFISANQDKKLVVLISELTKDKLQTYYDAKTKLNNNVSLLELSHAGRWYANGFISAYNFCEQYEKEHPSAMVSGTHSEVDCDIKFWQYAHGCNELRAMVEEEDELKYAN